MGELFALFMGFIITFVYITSFIAIILYVLGSLGLMKITDKVGKKGSWMAWLPLFNAYLIGKVAFNKTIGWILVILTILSGNVKRTRGVEGVTPDTIQPTQFTSISALILAILTIVSLHRIYSKFSSKAAIMTVFTILSFGLLAPIFLFAIRNNEVRTIIE